MDSIKIYIQQAKPKENAGTKPKEIKEWAQQRDWKGPTKPHLLKHKVSLRTQTPPPNSNSTIATINTHFNDNFR